MALDTSAFPSLSAAMFTGGAAQGAPDPNQRDNTPHGITGFGPLNVPISGILSGVGNLGGSIGAAAQAIGALTGNPNSGAATFAHNAEDYATRVSQPGYDQLPGKGGPGIIPWVAYQLSQAIPTLAFQGLATKGLEAVAGPAIAASPLGKLGASVPSWLGGGGLTAGADEAATAAATKAGGEFATRAAAISAANYPLVAGSLYQQAEAGAPDGNVSAGDAAKALTFAAPLAVSGAVAPTEFGGILGKGLEGGAISRVATAGGVGAAAMGIQGGLQTAVGLTFRPDLSIQDKARSVVDSIVTGGVVGGLFGGALGGLRSAVKLEMPANEVTTEGLAGAVDRGLAAQLTGPQGQPPAPIGGASVPPGQLSSAQTAIRNLTEGQPATPLPEGHAALGGEQPPPQVGAPGQLIGGLPSSSPLGADFPVLGRPGLAAELPNNSRLVGGSAVETGGPRQYDAQRLPGDHPVMQEPGQPGGPSIASDLPLVTERGIFDGVDTSTVARVTALTESKIAAGDGVEADYKVMRAGRAELAARSGEGEAPDDQTLALFKPDDLAAAGRPAATSATTTEAPADPEREAKVQAMKDQALSMVDRKTTAAKAYVSGLDVVDTPDLVNKVTQDLTDNENNGAAKAIAVKLGIIDKDFNERNLPAEIEAKAGALRDAMSRDDQGTVSQIKDDIANLQSKQSALDDAKARLAPAETSAEPDQNQGALALPEPEARPIEAPVADQTVVAASPDNLPPDVLHQGEAIARQDETPEAGQAPAPPDWAQAHADDIGGQVIYHDADSALVRGPPDAEGSAPYVGVSREPAQRTAADIDKFSNKNGLFQPEDLQKLRDAKVADQVKDRVTTSATQEAPQPRLIDTLKPKERSALSASIRREMNKLGLNKVGLELANTLGDAERPVQGQYHPLENVIRLALNQSQQQLDDTLHHETIHALKSAFTPGEWSKLVLAARLDPTHAWVDKAYADLGQSDRDEEKVAEMFSKSYHAPRDDTFISRMVQRLQAVLNAIHSAVTGTLGSATDILNRVKSGEIGARLDEATRLKPGDPTTVKTSSDKRAPPAEGIRGSAEVVHDTIQKLDSVVSHLMDTTKVGEVIRGQTKGAGLIDAQMAKLKGALSWSFLNGIVRAHGDLPGVKEVAASYRTLDMLKTHMAQTATSAADRATNLPKNDIAKVNKLASYAADRINPLKVWDDKNGGGHTWLRGEANWQELRDATHRANRLAESMGWDRNTGQVVRDSFGKAPPVMQAYLDLIANSEGQNYLTLASILNRVAKADPSTGTRPEFAQDPVLQYGANESIRSNPEAYRDFAKSALKERYDAVAAALSEHAATEKIDPDKFHDLQAHMSAVQDALDVVNSSLKSMDQAPYFHQGRVGDYFNAFVAKTQESGLPDPDILDKISDFLGKKGFSNFEVRRQADNPQVFVRSVAGGQMDRIHSVALEMEKAGLLEPDGRVLRGENALLQARAATRPWQTAVINAIMRDPAFTPEDGASAARVAELKAQQDKMVSNMRQTFLDLTPDSNLAKVLSAKEGINGFESNGLGSWAYRMRMGNNALANMAVSPLTMEGFQKLRDHMDVVKADKSLPTYQTLRPSAVYNELMQREADREVSTDSNILSLLRAVNHSFFIGLTPGYSAVTMSTLGQLSWPELSKKYGFTESARALATATPLAFRIMKEVLVGGLRSSLDKAADVHIDERALRDAKTPPRDAQAILESLGRGEIDVGSQLRELGRIADTGTNHTVAQTLKFASASAIYSEVLPKLITMIAAHRLYDSRPVPGLSKADYVGQTLREAQFEYQSYQQPRMFGSKGFAGPVTPLLTAFQKFHVQLMGKMYHEMHSAFLDTAKTQEERTAATRFLAANLVATTAIAGTLGVPAAAVIARVADAFLTQLNGGKSSDIQAAWRDYLAHTFGKDMGEILSRGAPRALGADFSQRLGEQNILPFSELLTDRRKWSDSIKDFAFKTLGSPVSMLSNQVLGGTDLLNGRVMRGLSEMAPTMLKDPLNAYRLGVDGYRDSKGNKLPMTPGAMDFLNTVMGFGDAKKAEYQEATTTVENRRQDIQRESGIIKQGLAMALEKGDQGQIQAMMQRAQQFDSNYPAYNIMAKMGGYLEQRANARVLAARYPGGVNPKDVQAYGSTDFANLGASQ